MTNIVFKTILSLILWPFVFMSFLIGGTVLLILMVFIHPRHLTPIKRFLSILILLSSGILLEVKGKKNVSPNKCYIWMLNHQSVLDVFVIMATIPQYAVGVEAVHHFKWPLWGWIIRRWGNIPIDRLNLNKAIESIEKAKEVLNNGTSIMIAPEGTRTITGELMPFKKGPFHLALGTKAEILPIGIKGTLKIISKTDWRISPGRVIVRIGKPISYKDYKDMSVEELRDYIRSKIQVLS